MLISNSQENAKVIVRHDDHMICIILNRPRVINSLDVEMIRLIQKALDEAEASPKTRLVVFRGMGEKGFCAGGDIKALSSAAKDNLEKAIGYLEEEYALDLHVHNFTKPIIVFADGITMGGGLGLAAGADMVLATERTRMAMPETRIGFFPDVGSTGWMFTKCPKGYPEFLGLTGYESVGPECVRVGLASHLVFRKSLPELAKFFERDSGKLSAEKSTAVSQLHSVSEPFVENAVTPNPEMDDWVKTYFSGKTSLMDIMTALTRCSLQKKLCEGVFQRLSERSPTALVLTLNLLRCNEGRALRDVFRNDVTAARFILNHPDYFEGVRARLLDKDDNPKWRPGSIEQVGHLDVFL